MLRVLPVLGLAACSVASPHFQGVPVTRVAVNGSLFDVRVRGDLAEAVRINSEYAPRLGPIEGKARFAMAQVSGCDVVGVLGDQSVTTGVLSCDARSRDWALPAATLRFDCIGGDIKLKKQAWSDGSDIDCDPM
ncbi:hypothetical protein [Phaeobacter sp. NW0010-22]|uniref:hypothetical protein n=1 Tax=Phaeobacter sp. NW0010-22 TaxID=3135907 RepID=UPI00310912D1